MGEAMTSDEITERLLEFIRESFLADDVRSELEAATPLLEWGVLNSMNISILLNFLRTDLGCAVPPTDIKSQNFRSVRDITSMVLGLAGAAPGRD
jgi:peptidyl carrier protein